MRLNFLPAKMQLKPIRLMGFGCMTPAIKPKSRLNALKLASFLVMQLL